MIDFLYGVQIESLMEKNKEESVPGLSISPSLAPFFKMHGDIISEISKCDAARLFATVAAGLALPDWQASTIRLEVLQHLAVASAQGKKSPSLNELKSWLVKLGEGMAGSMEDPSEDVFTSRVFMEGENFTIFEGIYESSAFYLQRFINILSHMPRSGGYERMRRSARALLALSDAVCKRTGIAPYITGQTLPLSAVSNRLIRQLQASARHVVFSAADVKASGIDVEALEHFVFDPTDREVLEHESLGHSTLERYPVLWINGSFYLALPTAVTVAIRRMIIEFCQANGMTGALYKSCSREYGELLQEMPILEGRAGADLRWQDHEGVFIANIARFADRGRLLHLCFVLDNFEGYDETGMVTPVSDSTKFEEAIQKSLTEAHEQFSRREGFIDAISLVVLCPWGRPLAVEFDGVNDPRWRVDCLSGADLDVMSWTSSFKVLSLWRMLDSRDALREMNVHLLNVNGLLNLFAWYEKLRGHLVPHGQLPDDYKEGIELLVPIAQNGLLEIRRRGVTAWNPHYAKRWDGKSVLVRRERSESYFSEDRDAPLYASMDDVFEGRLVAVYETSRRGWWVTVEAVKGIDKDFHYTLWHAITVWMRRAAPILESRLSSLPDGPVLWLCRFEDENVLDPSADVPSRAAAARLLEMTASVNEVVVHAKKGFLFSFREAKNIGESLLVDAFVRGVIALTKQDVASERYEELMRDIVPDQWARDVHLFSARDFRHFIQHSLRRRPVLISSGDDALLRLGRGWRVRERSAGPHIYGVEACCEFLGKVVDTVWEDIRSELKKIDREFLVLRLIENHEVTMKEQEQWTRTARAV